MRRAETRAWVRTGGALSLVASPMLIGNALAQQGTEVSLDAATTSDLLRVDPDGANGGSAFANLTELSLSVGLPDALGGERGTLFLLAAYTSGDDPGALTGSAHAPSNLAADDDWRLLEAWYEQRFNGGHGAVLAGVYAVDSEFDAKATTEVFLNGAFGTGLDWSESGAAGPGIFPETGLGLRLRYTPAPSVTLMAAVVDGEAASGPLNARARLNRNEGAFLIGEIDYQPAGTAFSRFALGAWTYSEDQPTFDEAGTDDSHGIYGFWEGTLYRTRGEGSLILNGFLRGGLASKTTNPFGAYLSAGLSGAGLIPGRPDDSYGLAISRGDLSSDFRDTQPLPAAGETAIEVTYAAQLTENIMLQPSLQYLMDPVDAPGSNAFVYGLRISIGL